MEAETDVIGLALYEAFREHRGGHLVSGTPPDERTTLDGRFTLSDVGRTFIDRLAALGYRLILEKPPSIGA